MHERAAARYQSHAGGKSRPSDKANKHLAAEAPKQPDAETVTSSTGTHANQSPLVNIVPQFSSSTRSDTRLTRVFHFDQ